MTNRTAPSTDSDTAIILTVTVDGLPESLAGSVLVFTGTDPETGENVHFGVDHRPAAQIIGFFLNDPTIEIPVSIEGWQIVGKGAF